MQWVPTGQTVNKEYYVEVLREFRETFLVKRPALFQSGQWHFHQDNAPVHNSILFTDYLTQMGIKTFLHPPYRLDVAPCGFYLFHKLRGCRYEIIEKKEAVTKVIDTLTQEDFHGAFQKLLERHIKCIAAGGDYIEGSYSFMYVISIKVPIRKSLETYLIIHVLYKRQVSQSHIKYKLNLKENTKKLLKLLIHKIIPLATIITSQILGIYSTKD